MSSVVLLLEVFSLFAFRLHIDYVHEEGEREREARPMRSVDRSIVSCPLRAGREGEGEGEKEKNSILSAYRHSVSVFLSTSSGEEKENAVQCELKHNEQRKETRSDRFLRR